MNPGIPTLHRTLLRCGFQSREEAVNELKNKSAQAVARERGLPYNHLRKLYLWIGKEVREKRMREKTIERGRKWLRHA